SVLIQVTHFAAVAVHAHNGEAASVIRRFGAAYIQKTSAVGEFHHVVDMGCNADIFVLVRQGIVRRVAGSRAKQHRCRKQEYRTNRKDSHGEPFAEEMKIALYVREAGCESKDYERNPSIKGGGGRGKTVHALPNQKAASWK